MFGLPAEDQLTHEDFLRYVDSADLSRVVAAAKLSETTGAPFDIEYRIRRRDGQLRWLSARGEMLRRADGSPLSFNGFLADITARKVDESSRQLVARELGHRMKNVLAVVNGIVSQSLRSAASLSDARQTIEGRVAALAAAQDQLIEGPGDGSKLASLAGQVLAPFDPGGARITRSGPLVVVDQDLTRALAMTLYELATNAVKYGALSK